MGHWARLDENNIVQEVIVIKKEVLDTGEWGDPSKFIKTSYNTHNGKHYIPSDDQDFTKESPDQSKALRFRYAAKGFYYDAENDVFIPPKPTDHSSVLDKTQWLYVHPIPHPTDGFIYKWDEDVYQADTGNPKTKGWVLNMPPRPGNSWTWNKDARPPRYEPPISEPSDSVNLDGEQSKFYKWDEDAYQADNTKGWVEVTDVPPTIPGNTNG